MSKYSQSQVYKAMQNVFRIYFIQFLEFLYFLSPFFRSLCVSLAISPRLRIDDFIYDDRIRMLATCVTCFSREYTAISWKIWLQCIRLRVSPIRMFRACLPDSVNIAKRHSSNTNNNNIDAWRCSNCVCPRQVYRQHILRIQVDTDFHVVDSGYI